MSLDVHDEQLKTPLRDRWRPIFSTATGGERSYADLAVVSHAYLLAVPDTADVISGDCAPPLRVYNR